MDTYRGREQMTLEEQQQKIDHLEHQLHVFKEEVARSRADMQRLMDVAGSDLHTNIYMKEAKSAKVSKWIWQFITVIMLGILILFSAAFAMTIQEDGFSDGVLSPDLILIVSSLAIIFFTTRQSSKARKEEQESLEMIRQLAQATVERHNNP